MSSTLPNINAPTTSQHSDNTTSFTGETFFSQEPSYARLQKASESSDYQSRVFNQEITGVISQEITGVISQEITGVISQEIPGVISQEITGVISQEIYWSGQSGKTKRVHVFIKAYSGRGEGLKG